MTSVGALMAKPIVCITVPGRNKGPPSWADNFTSEALSGRGGGHSPSATTQFIVLSASDPKYKEIEAQFLSKWRHPSTPGQVQSIFKIQPSKALVDRHNQYRDNFVQSRAGLKIHGKGGPGNTHRRFHATPAVKWQCITSIVGSSKPSLCSNNGCAVCGIAGQSLKLSLATSRFAGRFGKGLYFSSVSSKSNDYTTPPNPAKRSHRAMFLCSVVVGKGCKVYHDQPTLTAPPTTQFLAKPEELSTTTRWSSTMKRPSCPNISSSTGLIFSFCRYASSD